MVEGKISYCPNARAIVPTTKRLVDAMRGFGGKAIWLRNVTNAEAFKTWNARYDRKKLDIIDARTRELAEDSEDFKLWHGLDARDDDLKINKTRYSTLIKGSSTLPNVLETNGIDTLVFTGVVTNICVDSTVRRDDAELSLTDHRGCLHHQFS
jgi:ureidoacrylate peracid hydrolase